LSSIDRIERLAEPVISGIAAGEVVERPASVIKELVENALDAGAKRVEIDYRDADGGLRIAVVDDGRGIEAGQLELAVARHATSKLSTLSDLDAIATFGFRGEALASIAAVSSLELVSRTARQDAGAMVALRCGRVVARDVAASRTGTRVVVEDLFAAVPARRKFLKSAAAEYGAAAEQVRRFALARPGVHFVLRRNERKTLDLAPVASLTERLGQVLGRELGVSMVALEGRYRELSITGAVSPAGVSFGSARRVFLFVNGRWVQDRAFFRAVMDAYRTYLLKARYPAAAVFLDVPSDAVDVNVHPAKLEVRFRDPAGVGAFVVEAIGQALRGAAGPLGRWGLSERDIAATEAFARRRRSGPPPSAGLRGADTGPPAGVAASTKAPTGAHASHPARPGDVVGGASASLEELPGYRAAAAAADAVREGATSSEPLPLGSPPLPGSLGSATVIGQVFDGYIVCDAGEELVLVDQHAAHERILFERLMADYRDAAIESQPLLLPQSVTVGGDGTEAVARNARALADMGWELEPFGDEDVVVRSVPALAAGVDAAALVEKLVADLLRCGPETAASRLVEQVMATVACHAAVRVGKRLDRAAAAGLLREAATVEFSAACPHGRPVARVMSRPQIERMFGR
jgi:DNA mismatch repair protein MutL